MSANAEAGQAGSGSGSSPEDAHQPLDFTMTGDAKAPEKTISCTSCRKRKLKCDRIKPSCGTCSRLRHDCEYPERRRNLGSKRRNMKELEARLGMGWPHLSLGTMSDSMQRKLRLDWWPKRKQPHQQRARSRLQRKQAHLSKQIGIHSAWIWIWIWT